MPTNNAADGKELDKKKLCGLLDYTAVRVPVDSAQSLVEQWLLDAQAVDIPPVGQAFGDDQSPNDRRHIADPPNWLPDMDSNHD